MHRVLDLTCAERVTNEAIRCVSTSMPNLHTLILKYCGGLTEEVMEDIHGLKHLQHLDFGPSYVSQSGYFRLLKLFPRLQSLCVYLYKSVLLSVKDSAATIAFRNSGVDLGLYVGYYDIPFDSNFSRLILLQQTYSFNSLFV